MGSAVLSQHVVDARELAGTLLADNPERWRHTAGVARRAEELASTTDADDDPILLVTAAWLHDIGYAGPTRDTGFHPLDGARYLRRHGWADRLAALVAHHSGARFVADACGFGPAMADFPLECSSVADALTYADQTVGRFGRRYTIDERMADMLRRHGPDSPNARAHHLRVPYLSAVAARVEARLADSSGKPGYMIRANHVA